MGAYGARRVAASGHAMSGRSAMSHPQSLLVALGCLSALVAGERDVRTTEEGQRVIYDRYTWQRRELTKRLPLDQSWPGDSEIGSFFPKYGLDKDAPETNIPVPRKISPSVYLVGSNLVLTYLIDCGPGAVAIVDPGLLPAFQSILANVEKAGFPRSSIKWLLNTHAHFDHSMSDASFRKLGAQLLIEEADASAVEKGTRITGYFLLPESARRMFGLPEEFPATKVDGRLSDGENVHLGNKVLTVIHTPGHTPGSACFLLVDGDQNILFSGDTILFDNRLAAMVGVYGADNAQYAASLAKLAAFENGPKKGFRWDVLLPGHGTIVLDRAYMDVLKGWLTAEHDVTRGQPIEALPFSSQSYRMLMFGRP